MRELVQLYNGKQIRMLVSDSCEISFSIIDAAHALGLDNLSQAEVLVDGRFEGKFFIGRPGPSLIYAEIEVVYELMRKAKPSRSANFLKWILNIHMEEAVNQNKIKLTHENDMCEYFTVTQIAKRYGMSGKQLNGILSKLKIQYKSNKQWVLYSTWQDEKLTAIVPFKKESGEVVFHTYWTKKGMNFIHKLLTRNGIKPQEQQMSLFDSYKN